MAVKRLNITLEEELAEELERIAKELGEKKSRLIAKALTFYFDYLDTKIAEERLKKLEKGETEVIPAEEVFKEL
ncbi:MAG TPA: ribbon-helix-helix protein, CopG family [Aquificales bacterium]|nr:ribbon-helix-helix protein, CopG family [Aquificales bacterium]